MRGMYETAAEAQMETDQTDNEHEEHAAPTHSTHDPQHYNIDFCLD